MEDFEHSLLLIVLLLGILNARPPGQRLTIPILAAGLLLAFIPASRPLEIPWTLVFWATVPALLWQSARRLISADWLEARRELTLWAAATIAFTLLLLIIGSLEPLNALLLGALLGSILWRVGEGVAAPSIVSQIGPLTLIFLLVETAPQVETPDRFLGGVASGIAVGLVVAAGMFWVEDRLPPRWEAAIAVGQVYLAFALGTLFEVSAVAAALASVVGYLVLALRAGIWEHERVRPQPLNTWPGFLIFLVVFILLAWQAHQPVTSVIAAEVVVGALLGMAVALIGRRIGIPVFAASGSVLVAGIRAALLSLAALLLWPRGAPLSGLALALAAGASAFCLLLVTSVLPAYFAPDFER